MSEKEKAEAQRWPSGIQREAGSSEEENIRQQITAIRQGHQTGGYCKTEDLKAAESKLAKIINGKIAKLDPRENASEISAHKRELAGFAWKPTLVVKEEN